MYDGAVVDGPATLRQAILNHSDAVILNFTEKLLEYAVGRRVEYYDMPAIRAIVRDAAQRDYKMSSFILGVVNSPAFRMSRVPAESTEAGQR